MPTPAIVALTAAAPQVDVEDRARLLPMAREIAAAGGSVLLGTCHRVELYVGAEADIAPVVHERLERAGMTRLAGHEAARHIVRLATGLHSAVLAEDQILHQLRTAVTAARRQRPLGRDLDALLDAALRAARIGRSWRPAVAPGIAHSLADLALDRLGAAIGGLAGRSVLVVGTGVMGATAIASATRRGARVTVASPTASHAADHARRFGATTWSMDPGDDLAGMDGVVVALAGPWRHGPATAAALAARPAVVDLSMPPALDAAMRRRLGARLVDIDGLAASGKDDGLAPRYRRRLEQLVAETLDRYLATMAARDRSAAQHLADRVERERTAELAAFLRRRPDLGPEAQQQLDEVTRALSKRLFQAPLARLDSDPDGRRRQALDELFGP
jgi:glutamyl-tRNA reductase